jgi:hypothetical protein
MALKVRTNAAGSGRARAVRVEAKQWANKGGVLIPPAWNKRVVVPEVEARDTPKVRERERWRVADGEWEGGWGSAALRPNRGRLWRARYPPRTLSMRTGRAACAAGGPRRN